MTTTPAMTDQDKERALATAMQAAMSADLLGWTQRERACFEAGYQAARALPQQVVAGSVDTAALRKLALAAMPGEWTHKRYGVIVGGPFHQYTNGTAQSQIAGFNVTNGGDGEGPDYQIANADFCAAANPATIIALLDALDARQPAQVSGTALAQRASAPDEGEPNMLWDADEPEDGTHGDSPKDFAESYASNCMMAGEIHTVDVLCAYRGKTRTMKIELPSLPMGAETDGQILWSWEVPAAKQPADGGAA